MDIETREELQKISCKLIFLKEASEILKDRGEDAITGFYHVFEETIDGLESVMTEHLKS